MYGKQIKISPSVKLNDEPLEHIDHDSYYNCNNEWCLRDLCKCANSSRTFHTQELDWEDCPFIKPNINHQHPKTCPECDRLIMKETSELFAKALRMSEEKIMKEIGMD